MQQRKIARPARPVLLPPIHPNAGVTAWYRSRLIALIEEMHASTRHWLLAAYRADPPVMAADRLSAVSMREAMMKLTDQWKTRFDELARKLAWRFSASAVRHVDRSLAGALKDAGWSVEFKMGPAASDILKASVEANVSLIKTIPAQYHAHVEGLVMRSVQTGRDIGGLAKELEQHFKVSKQRAQFIARDQNNKASAAIERARQLEVGITEAVWLHSAAGKHPRPEHVAFSGKRYDVAKGALLLEKGKLIRTWPGREINCRCVCKAIMPFLIAQSNKHPD